MDYIPSLTSVLNADVQLYAKWTPRTDTAFIVRHMGESEGGVGYNDLLLSQEYNNGTTGDSIYAADYKNTTFSGFTWNNVNSSAVIKGDGTTILEIYYNRNYYTVTFYGNGGKTSGNQTTQTQSLKYGVEASLVGNSFIKPGYSFLMWNTSPDGAGTSYENNALYTIGTESVYLYAIWEVFESSYTVEHYLDNLDGSYPETPTYSDKINTSTDSIVNAAPRTEMGFTVDWFAPGTITSGTGSPDISLVLRLFYKRNSYNVTFNAGDGLGESYT
ncbi:MAG: InlB B-repeat-containing protein, partial [Clostridiales bacterium]|nr:InlB B-repeat-containing protein [Clostridiales bacterium]